MVETETTRPGMIAQTESWPRLEVDAQINAECTRRDIVGRGRQGRRQHESGVLAVEDVLAPQGEFGVGRTDLEVTQSHAAVDQPETLDVLDGGVAAVGIDVDRRIEHELGLRSEQAVRP